MWLEPGHSFLGWMMQVELQVDSIIFNPNSASWPHGRQELQPLNIAVRYITRVLQSDDYVWGTELAGWFGVTELISNSNLV